MRPNEQNTCILHVVTAGLLYLFHFVQCFERVTLCGVTEAQVETRNEANKLS